MTVIETIIAALVVQSVLTLGGIFVAVRVLRVEMRNVREWLSAHEKRDDGRFADVSQDVRDIRQILIAGR